MSEIMSFSKLRKKNSDYWKNLHMHNLYANNFRDEFTELFAKSMISLPIFPLLENDEVDYVIENLNFIVNNLIF